MTGYKGIAWTLALVFVVAAGSKFLDLGSDLFGLGGSWRDLVNAGIAAVVAFVVNYAAPFIDRYGVNSK